MTKTVRSILVGKKIESDYLSQATVKADQYCDTPLIPLKNPSRQLNWKVIIEKGAVYNPPSREGIYARSIKVGYGSLVNSSIFGRDSVHLEHGCCEHGGGLINGSITSKGAIIIDGPKAKLDDFSAGNLIIVGDLIGKSIEIRGNTVIWGNVISEGDVTIKGRNSVFGIAYSKYGHINIENSSLFTAIAGNADHIDKSRVKGDLDLLQKLSRLIRGEMDGQTIRKRFKEYENDYASYSKIAIREGLDELSSLGILKKKITKHKGKNGTLWSKNSGIVFGIGVSLLLPLGWVKSGNNDITSDQISMKSDIRLIDTNCEFCDKLDSSKKYLCSMFLDGKCNSFHYLSDKDVILQNEGSIITNTWRTFSEMPEEHGNILTVLSNVIHKRKNEEENQRIFDECISVGLGDLQQRITQIFDKRVYKEKMIVEDLRGLDSDAMRERGKWKAREEQIKQRGKLEKEREFSDRERERMEMAIIQQLDKK